MDVSSDRETTPVSSNVQDEAMLVVEEPTAVGVAQETPAEPQPLLVNDIEQPTLSAPTAPSSKVAAALAYLPSVPLADQTLDRCVTSASWVHNAISSQGSKKQKRLQRTRFNHLESVVTRDTNNIVPSESVVYSEQTDTGKLDDDAFRALPEYDDCTGKYPPRNFTISIRSGGEIINSIAHSQFSTYNMYSCRNMTPVFLSNSKKSAFGNKREKQSAMRKCFTGDSSVMLMKEFEELRDNAFEGFIRAMEERSPVNMAMAAWVCGRAAANHVLLRKNKITYSPLTKYNHRGLFRNDGSKSSNFNSSDFLSEIDSRSQRNMTFDTATRVFDTRLRIILKNFIQTAKAAANNKTTPAALAAYLRQTRQGGNSMDKSHKVDLSDVISDMPCIGMLTPRNPNLLLDELTDKSNYDILPLTASTIDAVIYGKGSKERKRKAADDFEKTLAGAIVSAGSRSTVGSGAEWSLHITQLFSQAFLETMGCLMACTFGVADPFSDEGIKTIKAYLISEEGNSETKRIVNNAALASTNYFLKMGNFTIPFVTSDPNDIIEGRRVSPNTPVLFIVNKKGNDEGKVFSLRDRLLVNDPFLDKALVENANSDKAASYTVNVSNDAPSVGGSLPIIRGPLTTSRNLVNDTKEGLSFDWYIHLSVLSSTGRASAAVAAGISRALSIINTTTSKSSSVLPSGLSDHELKKAMRRNFDRSKNLLASLGQSLSSWNYEEHNASLNSYWTSVSSIRSKALQDAIIRGNELGVAHQIDAGCIRDSFSDAEKQLRLAFFKAIDKPGDYVHHLSEVISSFSDRSSGAPWKKFVNTIEALPGSARKVFNVADLIKTVSSFRFPVANNKNHKEKLNNVRAASAVIDGLVRMTLQTAINTRPVAEAGSVSDGWSKTPQMEPSRMQALLDLSRYRYSKNTVTIPLNMERGSLGFSGNRRTDVLVLHTIILNHLVADKVALDAFCASEGTTLSRELESFIEIFTGKTSEVFKDANRFLTLIRYIWFNVAILSLTDSNVVSVIDMTQDSLGSSIFKDYMAILSLINKYGNDLSHFSIRKLIESYRSSNKSKKNKNTCFDSNKITSEAQLNTVLKRLTGAVSAFSGDRDAANLNGVKYIKSEDKVKEQPVTVVVNDVIGFDGYDKISKLLSFVYSVVTASIHIKGTMAFSNVANKIPRISDMVDSKLNISGPARVSRLERSHTVKIDLNDQLRDLALDGLNDRINKLTAQPDSLKKTLELDSLRAKVTLTSIPELVNKIEVPSGLSPISVFNIIDSFDENYPHLELLSLALSEISESLAKYFKDNILSLPVSELKTFLKNGVIFALAGTTTRHGTDLNNAGVDKLSKLLAHVSAEATLTLSRLQRTFYPIPPSFLTMSEAFSPSKETFDCMTDDFIAAVIDKIEDTASGITRCDDSCIASGLAEAGKNFNDSVSKTSAAKTGDFIFNPTDIWNKAALPHFDVAILPRTDVTNSDTLKLSAYYQGMAALPASSSPASWSKTLVGNQNYGIGSLPGLGNVCTFNNALDTLLAHPEESCDLVSQEIVKSSANITHNLASDNVRSSINKSFKAGTTAVLEKKPNTRSPKSPKDEDDFRISTKKISVSDLIFSPSSCHRRDVTDSDIVSATMASLPVFKQNVIEATKSLFESAAICNVLSKDDNAKEASKRIMRIIRETSPVIDKINVNRIAGLIGSISTPRQYNNFLMSVSDKRNMLIRRVNQQSPFCSSSRNFIDGTDASKGGGVYLGLLSLGDRNSGSGVSRVSLSDRFWMTLFEDCTNFIEDMESENRIYGSKLNSYAAMSSKANRLSDSMKDASKAKRTRLVSKMGDIEKFVLSAAVEDDPNSALNTLIEAQRTYTRLTAAAQMRKNDTALCTGPIASALVKAANNNSAVPQSSSMVEESMASGILEEIAKGNTDASSIFLASKLFVARELSKQEDTPETFDYILASSGVCSHAYYLADIICQRMNSQDISLFMGGTMIQRGFFTSFLLNNILVRQISPDLKTSDLTADSKTQLANLADFCSKMKEALLSIRRNKHRIFRQFSNTDSPDENLRADWAFASSVFSAYNVLRQKDSDTRTSSLSEMLSTVSPGGVSPIRTKHRSKLQDVLSAGPTIRKAFLTNYNEIAAKSKIVKTANIRAYREARRRKFGKPNLMTCFNSGKLFNGKADMDVNGRGFSAIQCEDYDMLIDGTANDDMMDMSSSEDEHDSSSSSSSSGYSSSDLDDDDDEQGSGSGLCDALETLDSLATPLSKIYSCGDSGYYDHESNEFDKGLRRMVGGFNSDDELFSDSDDDASGTEESYNAIQYRRSRRRAERTIYGPGHLGSSSGLIFDNGVQLGKFLTRKKMRCAFDADCPFLGDGSIFSDEEYESTTTDEDDTTKRFTRRATRRSRTEQSNLVKRAICQFVPKDIDIDENGHVSLVAPMTNESTIGFMKNYIAGSFKDRKNIRTELKIGTPPRKAFSSRKEKVSFRRALVKSTAEVITALKANRTMVYNALFPETHQQTFSKEAVTDSFFFGKQLTNIIKTRNKFITETSSVAPSLFSCEDSSGGIYNGKDRLESKGYLNIPMKKLASCVKDQKTDKPLSVDLLLAVKDKSHLDWLTCSAIVFARSFNVATGYALESTLKTNSVLKGLFESFLKLVSSTDGERVKVKSTLLSDIFNTRMAHTDSILGLFYPTAFMNHQLQGTPQEREKLETELLTLVRGVNSRQLQFVDTGDTSCLLNKLTSTEVAGPMGSRGGLSLFRMSLTDTVLGSSPLDTSDGRVKGAVSLEIASRKGICIDDSIFANKTKELVPYCNTQKLILNKASGPIYRYATGNTNIASSLGLSFDPSTDVANDDIANTLMENEKESNRGLFMKLSADGNLFGCFDSIARIARKFIEMREAIYAMVEKGDVEEKVKSALAKIKKRRTKYVRTPYGNKSIIRHPGIPSFSDNILLKAKEFRFSVTTLLTDITKKFSLNMSDNFTDTKFSLKSFERILEIAAILANTKTILRSLENRLQAAVAELEQYKRINDEGLSVARNVIAKVADTLCTLDNDEEWIMHDNFIDFAVNTEMVNMKEARSHITASIAGVHAHHTAILEMISSAIHTGVDDNDSLSSKQKQLTVTQCGRYVMHPLTKILVKSEGDDDDEESSCSTHQQVALNVLKRIEENKNTLLRARLSDMHRGRNDLRDIMSFNDEDVKSVDKLVKYLGEALASAASGVAGTRQQQDLSSGQSFDINMENRTDIRLPLKKTISYIPVAHENKQNIESSTNSSTSKSSISEPSSNTHKYLEQQEAHDLSSILNIISRHKFGEYNQSSVVALFNRSNTAEVSIPGASGDRFTYASDASSLQNPPSVVSVSKTPLEQRMINYISKLSGDLCETEEYISLSTIYDNMVKALENMRSLQARTFLAIQENYPVIDETTVNVLSQMKALKHSSLEDYYTIITNLEKYSPDPSIIGKTTTAVPIVASFTDNAAMVALKSSSKSSSPLSSSASSLKSDALASFYNKLDAVFEGDDVTRQSDAKDLIAREIEIRMRLLLNFPAFTEKIKNIFSMFSEYFKDIDTLKRLITEEAKGMIDQQLEDIDKEIESYRQRFNPILEDSLRIYREEGEAIKTSINNIQSKITELRYTEEAYKHMLEDVANKINSGTNKISVAEIWKLIHSSQQDPKLINNLKHFASENSEAVYKLQKRCNQEPDNLYSSAVNSIIQGQETLTVDFTDTLSRFPEPLMYSSEDDIVDVDLRKIEDNLKSTFVGMEGYAALLNRRLQLLNDRAIASASEVREIENRRQITNVTLRNQTEERRAFLKNRVSIATNTLHESLDQEVVQTEAMVALGSRVDKIVTVANRGCTPSTVTERANKSTSGETAQERKRRLTAEVSNGGVFVCSLEPLHDAIDRLLSMYDSRKSVLKSKVDLQLTSIFDLSMSVLDDERPETVPSGIVPGVCRLCAMMITNLHESFHYSDHAFEFDNMRSRETLRKMMSATISNSDTPASRYDALSFMEGNNGYIKELKFNKKQRVACMTPVNSLLGAYGKMTVQPGTVLIPTSELFSCDGLDHDKFRSMAHRSTDPALADSSKSADSIVETLADTSPSAEMLFYTYKDERRYFNSIPDCILENMSAEAISMYNTQCDQSTVIEDRGLPVFVGRVKGGNVTVKKTEELGGGGGLPAHDSSSVNMTARYLVAPGSLLNAKKEEMLRLSRVSDVNNAIYNDLDVHVAGSNTSMRISEIVKAACGGNDALMEAAKKMLLLGSVTAFAQQKMSSQLNDPSSLLSSSEVVKSLISSDLVRSSDLLTNLAYKQRFFPQLCNNLSVDTSCTIGGTVCPADLLGDFRRYKSAMKMAKNNGCGAFLNSIATIPTSSTPEGIADNLVHGSTAKVSAALARNQIASLAVNAMTDCSVDMVSALSSKIWRATNFFIPSCSLSGKPLEDSRASELKNALSRVIKDACMLQESDNGISSLNAILNSSSSLSVPVIGGSNDAERLFNAILRDSSSSPRDPIRNERTIISSILDITNQDISNIIGDIEGSIEKHRLDQVLSDIKNNILVTSDRPQKLSQQLRQRQPLSSILSAKDVRSGRLAMEGDSTAAEAVDIFKTAPLIVRHTALFHPGTPVPLSSQTRKLLTDRTKSTNTANNLLSESMPLLTDIVLHNTRDVPAERAIDRLLLSTFIVKQGKNFDDVDSTLPVALTSATHCMLSGIDSHSSRLISNLKLHVNDTSSILKNVERFEKFMGRYGDEYAMSNRQNCNCPFDLHHDFKASADEELVKSFAYARPEINATEIKETPYQCNKLLSDKHYIMAASKVDPNISGAALNRRISEWSDMRNAVTFSGAYEPSRLALSNGKFTTAGVNLDVIVRPNNASGVLGILGCHRKHLCIADLKTSVAANVPSMFIDNEKGIASELIQNALPHNKYIQKSKINSASVIFTNILEKIIRDLSLEISKDLSSKLLDGEFSVTESVMNGTQNILNKLLDVSTVTNGASRLETSSSSEFNTLACDVVPGYTKKAMRDALSCRNEISTDSVPFSSAADGTIAFDFLMSSDPSAELSSAKQEDCNAVNSDRSMISRILEAISNRVSDGEFSKILDDIESKIKNHELADNLSDMDKDARQRWQLGLQELSHLISFMRILKTNITPALSTGKLGEKMKLFISLISGKSRLENLLRYGMSNSSSVDLSHLKPLNSTAVTKNIEDTFTYRNVPPVFIMAMPENFSALFQREQSDPDFIINNRRSLTSFLNHPNTSSLARTARASVGAGGGNAMGIYPSSLLLQESTVFTAEPVIDTDNNYSFYSKVTQDPMMFVDPFKKSAGLAISSPVIASGRTTNAGSSRSLTNCSYLQVSMPTQSSGLVTNTGVYTVSDEMFAFKRRDGSVVNLNKIKPAVLCSDASTNLLDEFARADTVMEDLEVRFGFMPEILEAIAKFKGTNTAEVIKEMANQRGLSGAMVDRETGDVVVRKNGIAFPPTAAAKTSTSKSNGWGNIDGLLRGKLLPNFIASNPLGAASVNGIPIAPEGEYLAALKRNKAAGISISPVQEDDNEFGKGIVSEAAIRSLGGKLSSELKPLKEGWDNILKLQAIFSKTALAIRDGLANKTIKNPGNTTDIVKLLCKDIKTLRECKNVIRDTTSRLVATSDLMTGGFGGDPTAAMISPYKTEQFGVIGAVSSGVQMGIGSLISTRSKGIEAMKTAIEEQITLNSGGGRYMPEHGNLSYDLGNELLADHDSLFSLKNNSVADESSILNRVVDSLVKTLDKSSSCYSIAPHENVTNDASKRLAIAKLLSEHRVLLNSIANTLYFENEGESKAVEVAARGMPSSLKTKYGGLVALSNTNKDYLNDLFTTNV